MKKIIFYIIAILNAFLILTPTTFALPTSETITSTSTGWGYALNTGKNLTSQYYYKMSSQTGTRATTFFGFSSLTGSDDATHYYWNLQGTSSYFSTEKYMLSVSTVTGDDETKLTNGHMYSVQTFYCFDDYADDYPTGRSFYNSSTGSSNPTPTWDDVIDNKYFTDTVELSVLPYDYETVGTHDKCFAFNDVFIAQNDISRYGVEFSHTVLTENFPKYYVYGQYLDDLGAYPTNADDITVIDDYLYQIMDATADVTDEDGISSFSPYASLVLVPSRIKSMLSCYDLEDTSERNACLENNRIQIDEEESNLFDKNKANILNAYFYGNENILEAATGRVLYIPCEPNTTYTAKKIESARFSFGYTETLPTIGTPTYSINDNSATSLTVKTGENAKYLVMWYYASGYDTLTEEEILDSIRIIKETDISTGGEDEEESGADVNGTITDDDVSGATDSATDLFENFETEDFGISSIITAPLEFIQSLTSDTCQPLSVPIPFTDSNISLPCMTEVYEEHFGTFYDIYKIILVGFLSYRICLNVVRDIEKLKNPTNDKVEVVEL